MPLLSRISELAAKIEGTVGTLESLSGTDGVFRAYNVEMKPDIEYEEREFQGTLSAAAGVLGQRAGTCRFEVDLTGGGTAPDWAATLLPACGLKNTSGSFSLLSTPPEAGGGTKTISIARYVNGRKNTLHGCMGNVRFFGTPGKVARAASEFKGLWTSVTDASIITPTKETTAPLRTASATLTVNSIAMKVGQWELDLGNHVELREDPATVQGLHSAVIVARRPVFKIDPEAALVATYDPYGDMLSRTLRAISLVLGTSGNRLTFAAPKAQVMTAQDGDRRGIYVDQLEYHLTRNSANDDELTLVID